MIAASIFAFALACGPKAGDVNDVDDVNDEADAADAPDSSNDACGEGSCPDDLYCGPDRHFCEGALGIRPCIDGQCGPAPRLCMVPTDPARTCAQGCAAAGFECVANACEEVTAFGYKGPEWVLAETCTRGGAESRDVATFLPLACDDPLPFSEFDGFQCCCDDPSN